MYKYEFNACTDVSKLTKATTQFLSCPRFHFSHHLLRVSACKLGWDVN